MLRQGTILGSRYEILSQIGSGGMSEVYKARCHKLNREVAIKVLKKEFSSDQNFVSKFRMEAQNAAKLSHPNIVSVYDVGEDQGVHYIVMELIKGITLKKYIERKKKLEIRESIEVAMQVARGIEAAHAQHIIHRDIKPQNIMISMEGKVKVTDFGIARAVSTQTISSNSMGSVHYISPEQARGGYCDEKSDIYSLGITFYEMLTGRVPFDGDSTVAVALLHIQGEMVPPRQYEPLIPVSLEKIIMKCTQKKPEMRYASATELIEDLKKALTMPNEDFVNMPVLNSNAPTRMISEDDYDEIRRRKNESRDVYEDNSYGRRGRDRDDYGDRGRRRYDDYDDYDDYDMDEVPERNSGMEKVVTAASLAVAFVIIIIAAILLLKGCSLGKEEVKETTTAAETTLAAEQVPMVSLLGKTREEAAKILTDLKLTYTVETGTSDDYPEGTVYEQQYKAGDMVDVGTEVLIRISVGKGTVTVPSGLEGKSIGEATAILEEAGIVVATEVKEQNHDTVAPGKVVGTDPAAGTTIQKNQKVTLLVSSGPAIVLVDVPDLLNLTEAKAISQLENHGLKAGSITYEDSDTVTEGRVISQSIKEGKSVEENTAVDFVVSKGAATTEVPDLRYSSLSEAKTALMSSGLTVGSVKEEYDEDSTKGLVIKQSVSPNKSVQKGTSVDLVVSKGAEPQSTTAETTTVPFEEGQDSGDPNPD